MARNFKNAKRQESTETTELGKVLYVYQEQLVVKLVAKDIPYPNSAVLDSSSRAIGKVDEVLGRIDDVHVTVKLNGPAGESREGEMMFSYVDKFIPRKRFLPREEVEKRKEAMDRVKPVPEKAQSSKRQDRDQDQVEGSPAEAIESPATAGGAGQEDGAEIAEGRSSGGITGTKVLPLAEVNATIKAAAVCRDRNEKI